MYKLETSTAANAYNASYTYTYDANGNILSVKDKNNKTTSYVYDSANQLVRENNQAAGKTWVWAYDNAGNIENRKEYAYTTGTLGTAVDTVDYDYGDTNWGDLLTKYDGQTISYDEIGNPTSYYNGTRWSMTWEHGRELTTISNGSTTWTNTYNADGLRTKRTNGTTTYEYLYLGDKLIQMHVGDDVLKFGYDASGSPMYLQFNNSRYFYATNVQGDVMALVHTSGTAVAEYTYDAWGNILTTTGSMADTVGQINPLRYRGYVYDAETGLYYVSSRYYDPEIGRFINADSLVSTGQGILGCNMFSYCLNNPVNFVDRSGKDAIWIHEGDSAYGFGHSGLLVQDEEEKWYFFYWGRDGENGGIENFINMFTVGVPSNCVFEQLGAVLETRTMEGIQALIRESDITHVTGRANLITDFSYFEGDYTATYEYLEQLYDNASNTKYHFLINNCAQISWRALAQSNEQFRYNKGSVIPDFSNYIVTITTK